MMDDQWGPLVEHDGKGRPVPIGIQVWIEAEARPGRFFREVLTVTEDMLSWDWSNWQKRAPCGCLILATRCYRVRRSPEAQKLIERIKAMPSPKVPA